MTTYGTLPFQPVQFDANGKLVGIRPLPPAVTDLVVVSHGWNNDATEATSLYRELLTHVSAALQALPEAGGRSFAAIGVYWPSATFDFGARGEAPDAPPAGGQQPRPQGRDGAARQALDQAMHQLAAMHDASDPTLHAVQDLVRHPGEDDGPRLVAALRKLIPCVHTSQLDGSDAFFGDHAHEVFGKARHTPPHGAAPALGAPAFGRLVGSLENGIAHLLNLGTYYTMKARASVVGADGLAPLLDAWAEAPALQRIHLAGHSFGARLVTAAAMASHNGKLASMSLLQAAFSHNGFAKAGINGYFRQVVDARRLQGPVMITYSARDAAVGEAYALAARLAVVPHQGSEEDHCGGLGASGALGMLSGESQGGEMVAHGTRLALRPGLFHNLQSTAFISSHHDVRNENVAWAVANAIAAAP